MEISQFRALVWKHHRTHGRHDLPWRALWRGTYDPYRIFVSEVMLQQTQVERVIPYFTAWMKTYPTVRTLAAASRAEVFIAWQGLGYNRRAKMLHDAAKAVVAIRNGKFPQSVEELQALPGVGPYTARAVAAFAYNQDVVFVETNIRTVIIHHFFSDKDGVTDAEIAEVLTRALPRGRAREWYGALMDYGTHLKRSGIKVNAKSKGYVKQSTFKGSNREARGALLKRLSKGAATRLELTSILGPDRVESVAIQLEALLAEGFVTRTGREYHLAP